MRVLHVVKTADGAEWAAREAGVQARHGIEVHVAVPSATGRAIPKWQDAGAHIHVVNLDLPARHPWLVPGMCRSAIKLVADVKPHLIHSHFVSTTLLLRLALGRNHEIPRIFQVAGPLHMEHRTSRIADLATAGTRDYWIGSSHCIVRHYWNAGVPAERVFHSYYGARLDASERTGYLRQRLGIDDRAKIVGNINFIYPPKRFLGQSVGLKCHEDVIDAINIVQMLRKDVVGVLIGSTFGTKDTKYEQRLRARAQATGLGKILMPGYFAPDEVAQSWGDFDCAVHTPLSENCGGVIEPLMAQVPTIAGMVGGLPEVVVDGLTGVTVPIRDPRALAEAILKVLDSPQRYRCMAERGRRLVKRMFDIERTGLEVIQIYRHLLEGEEPPPVMQTKPALAAIKADESQTVLQ